jgi:hypothetical protein
MGQIIRQRAVLAPPPSETGAAASFLTDKPRQNLNDWPKTIHLSGKLGKTRADQTISTFPLILRYKLQLRQ